MTIRAAASKAFVTGAGVLLGAVLFAAGDVRAASVPVVVDTSLATLTAAPGAVGQEGVIPVYPHAQEVVSIAPTSADLRALLPSMDARDLATIRGLRAIAFRVPGPASADEIMRWYAAQQAPPASALSPDAAHAEAVAGPRTDGSSSRTGFRPLASLPGYLVVSATTYPGRPQDLQVTVARVEGSPGVVRLLDEVIGLVGRSVAGVRLGGRNADVAAFAFPGSAVQRDIMLPRADVPLLLRQIAANNAQPAVQRMLGAILAGAESLRLTSYVRQGLISPEVFFQFYRNAAGRLGWDEVMKDDTNPERPTIIFSLGQGRGVVMLRSEITSLLPTLTPGVAPPAGRGTKITLLVVEGKVDLTAIRQPAP